MFVFLADHALGLAARVVVEVLLELALDDALDLGQGLVFLVLSLKPVDAAVAKTALFDRGKSFALPGLLLLMTLS